MAGAYRHYDLFRWSTFCMADACMLHVDKTRESAFNFYVDKSKGETCESILQMFVLALSNEFLMQRDTAMLDSHWMSDCIVEGTYYADEEQNKINNEADPKKGENVCVKN